MAAASRMLSVVREELPILASELAASARATTSESSTGIARVGECEAVSLTTSSTTASASASMNPLGVRQITNKSIKEGESILSHHLTIRPQGQGQNQTTSLLEHISQINPSVPNPNSTGTSTSTSMGQILEMDIGLSVREAISNAGQTGLEEALEQSGVGVGDFSKVAGDLGKVILEEKGSVL